ncbi:MAG: hypothetical protein O8C67_15500 [Candidatus Methanoperedens sp.]|nr:hypothetical protein [Candidatus Methanoperedens sp.]
MIYLKNALEMIDEVVVIPLAIITFFLLIYIVVYLYKKDPDVIRSRIFLKYDELKKAFLLLAVFAFILVLHVSMIYVPHFYSFEDSPLIEDIQRFFGLILVLVMITFVYKLFSCIRNVK